MTDLAHFTIYNSTGLILRSGVCVADDVTLQASNPGDYLKAEQSDVSSNYVDVPTTEIRSYSPAELTAKTTMAAGWVWLMPDRVPYDARSNAEVLQQLRLARQPLLDSSDWTQQADVSLSNAAAWVTYRQALRDITLQPDLRDVTWPTRPTQPSYLY